ncbi:MAG: hypothetical protein KF688_16560 [Pirellulales bacterium]|nr:hypothetical protein [Pirellulales bacterium]
MITAPTTETIATLHLLLKFYGTLARSRRETDRLRKRARASQAPIEEMAAIGSSPAAHSSKDDELANDVAQRLANSRDWRCGCSEPDLTIVPVRSDEGLPQILIACRSCQAEFDPGFVSEAEIERLIAVN